MSSAQTSLDKAYILDYMGTVKPALEREHTQPSECSSLLRKRTGLFGVAHKHSQEPRVPLLAFRPHLQGFTLLCSLYRYCPKRMWARQSSQMHTRALASKPSMWLHS